MPEQPLQKQICSPTLFKVAAPELLGGPPQRVPARSPPLTIGSLTPSPSSPCPCPSPQLLPHPCGCWPQAAPPPPIPPHLQPLGAGRELPALGPESGVRGQGWEHPRGEPGVRAGQAPGWPQELVSGERLLGHLSYTCRAGTPRKRPPGQGSRKSPGGRGAVSASRYGVPADHRARLCGGLAGGQDGGGEGCAGGAWVLARGSPI